MVSLVTATFTIVCLPSPTPRHDQARLEVEPRRLTYAPPLRYGNRTHSTQGVLDGEEPIRSHEYAHLPITGPSGAPLLIRIRTTITCHDPRQFKVTSLVP